MNIAQYGGMSWAYNFAGSFVLIAIREPVRLADQLASIAGVV